MVLVRACLTNARMLASSMNHMHDVCAQATHVAVAGLPLPKPRPAASRSTAAAARAVHK
jgi:hypothetical protein